MRLFWIFCFVIPVFAGEPVDWEMVGRIRNEAFNHSEVMEILSHLTEDIGPRITNSPQMLEANNWTKKKFEEWGIKAELEPWEFGQGWSFSRCEVRVIGPQARPLIALPKAWTVGTGGEVEGEAIHVSLENESDFEKYRGKLKGKIVFLSEPKQVDNETKPEFKRYSENDLEELGEYEIPETRSRAFMSRYYKRYQQGQKTQAFLKEEGALATVSISSFPNGVVRVTGTNDYKPGSESAPSQIVMAVEDYNRICRQLDKDVAVKIALNIDVKFQTEDTKAYNTIGEIPAKGKLAKEIVMAGAHLDSWHAGTGAVDDGAGVAVVMEAARILKKLGFEPHRSIQFGLWSSEEQGLNGSKAYVTDHYVNWIFPEHPAMATIPDRFKSYLADPEPKADFDKFSVYFNIDNGGGKFRGIYAQENQAAVPIFKAWLEPFADVGANEVTMRTTRSTDHISFDRAGLPGFQFIQDPMTYFSKNHHTNLDVLDHVNEKDLKQASAIMASFIYHAAQRAERFPRKPFPEKVDRSKMLDQMMPKKKEPPLEK